MDILFKQDRIVAVKEYEKVIKCRDLQIEFVKMKRVLLLYR